MGMYMKDNGDKTKEVEKGYLIGIMEIDTKVFGSSINQLEWVI